MDIPSPDMFSGLDYTLRVISGGLGKLRYRWEIRQHARAATVEISDERYPTMEKAYAAGVPVLTAWQRGERKVPDRANAKREPAFIKPPSNTKNWRRAGNPLS